MIEPPASNAPAAQGTTDKASSNEPAGNKMRLTFPVVGIGASAGGLSAAIRFFENTSSRPGMAFVVILHLSPEHDSQAAEILQRATRMPVVQVARTIPIEPDRVYVIAPAVQLAMSDGKLVVGTAAGPRGQPVAIDLFFRTLAEAHRERAIAIVLSGTGSDGSLGLGAVKTEGGLTLVRSPDDAEYEGMPSAAIATGQTDFILPVVEIPDKLAELWQNARRIELPDAHQENLHTAEPTEPVEIARTETALQDIMAILAARTGSDFRHYKRGTVLRRLERRLQVTRQPNLPTYRDYLDNHPQETAHLLQDMLISVTSFFRDRGAFESLEREAVATLFKARPLPSQVRAWSVGCATGEEAYSLAMLLTDHLPPTAPAVGIQIFATDVDERALAIARAGVFPEAILTDVPPMRLNRFFDKIETGYRVKKTLREQVMFARQNILRDPSFSRLDIITCRNLLMYLERDVQSEVLEVFHFALNPGGLLFLGTAETADFLPDHFTIIDKKNRIYRANPVRQGRRDLLPLRSAAPGSAQRPIDVVQPARAPLAQLHQRMLEMHAPVSVVIDANRRILHTSPGASRYLRYVDGVPSQDLLEVVLPELVSPLRAALLLVGHSGKRVAARPVAIAGEQGPITVHMVVHSGELATKGGPMLVVFSEVDTSLAVSPEASQAAEPAYQLLEDELQRLQQQLEGTIGDSALSSEALRASNEELQSMNEELRSATEELETSKEELQSVNEELTTVNFELKTKVEETAKANDDLSNLIGSMNMATVFVDRSMQIRGFTPLANQLFNIRSSDIGRPLHDLTHRLRYEGLAQDVEHVIAVLRPIEREIGTIDGTRWYLVRVTAYRTNEDRIDGAVLNFIDITERRNVQQELQARDERLRLVAESTEDYAMITLDATGNISGWNTGAKLMFGYSPDEILGTNFRILFVPEDREAGQAESEVQQAAKYGRAMDERWHMRKDGSRFYCSGITTPILGSKGIEGYAKIARDLTERQLFERQREELLQKEQQVRTQLEAANALRGEFLAVMSHELKNPLNLILMSAELIGRSPETQAAPEVARAVDTIRRTVNGQSQIIDDLLDLSRLSTGKMAINRGIVQWKPVIERIAESLRAEVDDKHLVLEVFAEDLSIYADAVRVEQIVWNLVSNALKFTPAGGRISLRLSREGSQARLDVTDTGRGIDPAFAPLVFNMFEQGDRRSSTRRDKGLGIGLALVKSLAELHGGSVEVVSAGLGQGSTFTVHLPLFEGNWTGSGSASLPDENPATGLDILLVDDDTDYLEMFASLLRKTGAAVTAVADAKAALAAANTKSFDVMISDIAMPDMDGRELVSELRKLPRTRALPAIAVSGFGRSEDVELSKLAGFDAHLNKPLSLDVLCETLARVIGKAE